MESLDTAILIFVKTTVDIPEQELRDAMRFTQAKTMREAIKAAIAEFNRRRRVEEVIELAGSFPEFPTNEEIESPQLAAEEARRRGFD